MSVMKEGRSSKEANPDLGEGSVVSTKSVTARVGLGPLQDSEPTEFEGYDGWVSIGNSAGLSSGSPGAVLRFRAALYSSVPLLS